MLKYEDSIFVADKKKKEGKDKKDKKKSKKLNKSLTQDEPVDFEIDQDKNQYFANMLYSNIAK